MYVLRVSDPFQHCGLPFRTRLCNEPHYALTTTSEGGDVGGPPQNPLLGLYFGTSQQNKTIQNKTDINRNDAHPALCPLLCSYHSTAPQPVMHGLALPRLASRVNLILLLPRMQQQQTSACTWQERAWRRSGACLPGCFFSSVCLCARSSAARSSATTSG